MRSELQCLASPGPTLAFDSAHEFPCELTRSNEGLATGSPFFHAAISDLQKKRRGSEMKVLAAEHISGSDNNEAVGKSFKRRKPGLELALEFGIRGLPLGFRRKTNNARH